MSQTGRTRGALAGFAIVVLLAGAGLAEAQQQGEWHLGGRAIFIDTDALSEPVLDSGSSLAVDSALSLEVDATYMLGHTWGLEIMATAAKHDLSGYSGELDGLDVGSVWIAESTVTLRYIVARFGSWRPYLGAGVAGAYFFESDTTDEAGDLGIDSVESNFGWGFVGQIGLLHRFNDHWILTLDLKWLDLPIDVDLESSGPPLDTVEMDLDPMIVGIGAALRF
jgi:outer membrane protein